MAKDIEVLDEFSFYLLMEFVEFKFKKVLTLDDKESILKVLNKLRVGEVHKPESYFVSIFLRKYEKFLNKNPSKSWR